MQRSPSTPPEIDGYVIDRLIGSGGFADVFLYEQQLPRRKVAVKALLTHELTASARAAFTTEADLMARLSTHPYIVTIYQAGVARDGRPYLVMEYCSRPSLAERYKRQPLSVVDALRTGIRLAGAVATAHAAGILHRDIKPGNVLTNDYGWPALTDFGIASEVAGPGGLPTVDGLGGTDVEASVGASVGMSVPWSPPEMFEDVPQPDVRSDVFSLAATIHTVLAGRTPFEVPGGPNGTLELVARIERGELTPMTRDDVPPALTAVLAKGMSPRRENRYSSAIEFARALQRVELELGYAPTTIEVPLLDEEDTRPGDGGSDDETSLRGVAQIIAQPPLAPLTNDRVSDDRTRAASLPAPTSPAATPHELDVPPPPPPSRRRILLGVIIGVLAVLAIAAVAVAIQLGGSAVRPANTPTASSTGGSAIVGPAVPQATNGVATPSADGTSVDFSWTNPSAKSGDVYYWARAETPADRQASRTTTATVTGVVPGSKVCINVEIGRAGATGEPLVICTAG
ncbi:MAG: serine/threonine protein kinase [Actinomycetota bacterium]|nr:serine/threonine protein kinase [Actinomycetota bacterium]